MSRSQWKGPFLDKNLFIPSLKSNTLTVWSRNSIITANWIGSTVHIHNGKEFKRVQITREKVGYKFGEFSITRKHTKKQKPMASSAKKITKK